jgi:hypothetical protein
MMILFLHGWRSVPGGVKPTYLAAYGHTVSNPALPDEDFDAALRIAQAEFDRHRPDVIVGSSRGGAVAMNVHSGDTPLVLLCPAWKKYGASTRVKSFTTILHSRADDVVPFADSEELARSSGLPESALIAVGTDHRLAEPAPLQAMLAACERYAGQPFNASQPTATSYFLALPKGRSILLTGDRLSISRLSFDPARHKQILDLLKEPARLEGDCLYLPDPQVSRQHAILQRADDGSWSIEDAGSRNGTLVNDQAVTGRTPLKAGDRIAVGQSHIDFFAEPDWVPAPEWFDGGSD